MTREVLNGLDFKSPLLLTGSAGSSGQVLTSQGAGATPTWAAPASTGPVVANRQLLDDIAVGFNGATTTFNLAVSTVAFSPANALALEVVLGGVQQKPGSDYTVSGSQITFTTAPAAGLPCYIIGSTYAAAIEAVIADRALLDDISSGFNGATTTFNLTVSASPYSPGSVLGLEVVLGGVQQRPTTDYTVSGSTITFTSAPVSGLTCLIIGWVASSTLAASATTDTTNASNITTGTLAAARLPSVNLGTTAVDLTRASGALSLTGVSIDGSAGSVAWANVSSRPTAVSAFTNDANYITSAGAPVQSVAGKTGAVTLAKADVGLGSVEDTALSTWAGSTNITTVGTLAQTLTVSSNPGLSLTGAVAAGASNQGVFSQGTLGFTGSRLGGVFASSQAQYFQVILQNTSNNSNASCDFVVCNDASTDSTYYGNFGINSSTYTGSGAFNAPSATYLTATSGPLVLGTTTNNTVRVAVNSETTDAITVQTTDVTLGKTLKTVAGTASAAPVLMASGTNLSAAAAGAIEYDGTYFYATPTTTSGRGHLVPRQTFRLTGAGSNLGPTIADFFGATSSINLAASSVYEIEILAYLLKNTAGTITWTLTASSAPTLITGTYQGSPVTGIAAGAMISGYAGSRGATTAAFSATASVSAGAYMTFRFAVQVVTNLATTFKLQVTSSAGTVTPQAGSFYTVQQVSGSTGSFA